MGQQARSAGVQDDDERDANQALQQRIESPREQRQTQILRNVGLVHGLELGHFLLFLHISANHADAGEMFLDAARDVAEHGLNRFKTVVDLASKEDDGEAHEGRGCQRNQRQLPVDRHHHDQRQNQRQAGFEQVHQARAEHHAHGIQVVRGARHDVAGAEFGVEIRGKRHQFGEQIVA